MTRVIYGNSKNSDFQYLVDTHVADPTFIIDTGKNQYLFVDHREYEIFPQKKVDSLSVELLNPIIDKAETLKLNTSLTNRIAFVLFEKFKLAKKPIQVSSDFPLDTADFLRSKGYKLSPQPELYPERANKSDAEAKQIRNALLRTQKAYRLIENILEESKIKGKHIWYKNTYLTSEYVKQEVDLLLLENNLLSSEGMIISSGKHAAIPHHEGHGKLAAHSTIICDIFPKDRSNGYFADMTRAYVKGEPSEHVQKMYSAVKSVQSLALKLAKPGASAKQIHQQVSKEFIDRGFDVDNAGFIHGTGHGLGLDIHESPYIKPTSDDVLQPGHVVTIEPGLYYPEHGGIRIEDVIVVTKNGNKNLTKYHKNYIIK